MNRLSFARRARELGFSIEHLRALLALAEHAPTHAAPADRLTYDQLLQEISRELVDLSALRREIAYVRQHRGETATRRIIEALAPVR